MLPYFELTKINFVFFNIQVWGLFVALGIVLSILIAWKRAKKFGTNGEQLLEIILYTLIGGLIFARAFHIVFYQFGFYYFHPAEIFKIWSGGLSSFGGFLGAGFGFYLYVRKRTELKGKHLLIIDQLSFAGLFGWIIGRFGCTFIHDHLGKLSDSFWAVRFPAGARLDMAVMEIIFLIPLAILFFVSRGKKLFAGFYLTAVLIYYGILRFILDFFRATDIIQADVRYLGLTPGQYFGILAVVIGLFLLSKVTKKT